jgi:hypothetical protein
MPGSIGCKVSTFNNRPRHSSIAVRVSRGDAALKRQHRPSMNKLTLAVLCLMNKLADPSAGILVVYALYFSRPNAPLQRAAWDSKYLLDILGPLPR